MVSEVTRHTLGDYIALQRGTTYKSKLLGLPGPVLLGLASIARNGGFRPDSLETYGGECPEKLLVHPGELYVSLKDVTQSADLLGAVARLPRDHLPGRLTQDTVKLIPKTTNAPMDFIYWLLRTPQYRDFCRAYATGTTNLGLDRQDFLAYPVPEPSTSQRSMIEILDTLDDKIELNCRMNETLEEITRAIFKSWFVDFDPVRTKAEGRLTGLPEHIDKLFPDSFVDSELGQIPKGWEVKDLDQVTSLIIDHRGKTPKKLNGEWSDKGYPAISAKNVKGGRIQRHDSIRYVNEELYRKWMKTPLERGDIAMTSEAPLGELFYFANRTGYLLSQRLYGIRADRKVISGSYLYYWLMSHQAQYDMLSRATGTTVVGIRQSELRRVSVLVPRLSIVESYTLFAGLALRNIEETERQSSTIELLRDTFLPKLISGELRIENPKLFLDKHLESTEVNS